MPPSAPAPARPRRLLGAALALLAALVLAACGGDGGGGGGTLIGLARPEPLRVGDASLPDVTGAAPAAFRFRADAGGLLAVYFGYTACPDLCPTTMSDLREALHRLGDERAGRIRVAMATVDPGRDDRTVLTGYLGSFFDTGRFVALRTTDTAALKAAEDVFLATSSVTTGPDGSVEVAHSATTYVVDETGTVLVEWPFGLGPKDMTHDLRILLDRIERT